MKIISSRENPFYKELKHLASSSQARRKAGRTLLDGIHLCETYLQHESMPVFSVVSESAILFPEVERILTQCHAKNVQCITMPDALYQTISQVENGIGLLFVIDIPYRNMPFRTTHSVVALDSLQDPGNLGSILRSAAAADIKDIFCGKGTVFAWSPKVLRAGMGAHFVLNIHENTDLVALLSTFTIPIVATSSYAGKNVYDMNLRRAVVWLLGHEGKGISKELLGLATEQVKIPHSAQIESLNVAASAAVCFFEQIRQKNHCS